MKELWIFLSTIILVIASACKPSGSATIDLRGTQWVLSSLLGREALPGGTIQFDKDEKIYGSSGCNSFFGTYTAQGNNLKVSDIGSTLMACMEPMMQQEVDFFNALSQVQKFELQGNSLKLLDASDTVLIELTKFDTSLDGTQWIATGLNNGLEAVVSTDTTTKITLTFKDGKITGTASCNLYDASYEVNGENLKIGSITATEMACDEPLMRQEQDFFAALGKTAVYRITPNSLEFRSADGALQVSFSPAP